MLADLKGKRAIVTGSTQGIGEAVARGLAAHGVRVVIHGRDSDKAASVAASINATGGSATTAIGDVTSREACRQIVQRAVEALGGLDILVNNAGGPVSTASSSALLDVEDYAATMDLNVRSVLAITSEAYPHLRVAGGGSIINTGAISARTGGKVGLVTYAAAKAAVHSITRTTAREFGADNIRVNTVSPGVILTPFHDGMTDEAQRRVAANTALGRVGNVEEAVGVYLFLASAALSGYITGQAIDVNGGWYMS